MKLSLALMASVFMTTVMSTPSDLAMTNSTLYSFHFLGINGTDANSNVGYL
jgi:hypothetical protein